MGKEKGKENVRPWSFVNPYNFIPLGSEISSFNERNKDCAEIYTGRIEYFLRTKTPLFIPNTSNDNAFQMREKYEDHKSYDFFSYKDLSDLKGSTKDDLPYPPVIPGSEIRGMLRSNYEILTNSCMSALDDEKVLSKRTLERFKAGLLKRVKVGDDVQYSLIKVEEDCLLRTEGKNNLTVDLEGWNFVNKNGKNGNVEEKWRRQCYIQESLPEGSKVLFTYQERGKAGKPLVLNVEKYGEQKQKRKFYVGYILKGEKGPEIEDKINKHCAHVFKEIPAEKAEEVYKFSRDNLENMLDVVLDLYNKNTEGAYKEYKKEYEKFKDGKGNDFFPVYYSKISYKKDKVCKHIVLLSPACITREVYSRKLSDMVENKRPCEKTDKLCPACALFGTFKEENRNNITSRIRMTDLECIEENKEKCFGSEPITIQNLSQPKFSPEFYMKKPDDDAVFWTYEYYVDSKGKIHENNAGINGRKFYWHHADFRIEDRKAEPGKMNKTIRPLNAGINFKGTVYFQNLSEKELNMLCYLIDAGEVGALDKKKHGYKLGAAKPLGFGSVAMRVEKVWLRKIEPLDDGISFKEVPYTFSINDKLFDENILSNFKKMTCFDKLRGRNISYPRIKEKGDIFEWFQENHKGYKEKGDKKEYDKMPRHRTKMVFDQYLEPMCPFAKETKWKRKIGIRMN